MYANLETFQNLSQLQEIDLELIATEQEKSDLKNKIDHLKQDTTGLEEKNNLLQQRIQTYNNTIGQNKEKIEVIKNELLQEEEKKNHITNDKEYGALLKEIELKEMDIQLLKKESREIENELEMDQVSVKEFNQQIQENKDSIKKYEVELKKIEEANQAKIANLNQKKKKITKTISPDIIKLYQKIKNNIEDFKAIAYIKENYCQGCFTTLPLKQLMNIQDKQKIDYCENCSRIIIPNVENL